MIFNRSFSAPTAGPLPGLVLLFLYRRSIRFIITPPILVTPLLGLVCRRISFLDLCFAEPSVPDVPARSFHSDSLVSSLRLSSPAFFSAPAGVLFSKIFCFIVRQTNSDHKVTAAGPQIEPKTLHNNSSLSLCHR